MPIINHAAYFDEDSVSSDGSLDSDLTESPETEPVKGVYFLRARLLRGPGVLEDHALKDHALEDHAPHALEDHAPHALEDHAPHALEDHAPHALEDHAPHALEDHAPHALEDHAPHALEDHAPHALEDHILKDHILEDHILKDHILKEDHAPHALVNVGGSRYSLPWSTLDDFPESRLGRLRLLSAGRAPAELLCDDYDERRREFFFDRDPGAFRLVLNHLAAGKLRLRGRCVAALRAEIGYWGLDPARLERCCRRRLRACEEEQAEQERQEEAWRSRRREALRKGRTGDGRHGLLGRLGEAVENPRSGPAGQVFACLSVAMVTVIVFSLCISSMPDLQAEADRGECSEKCLRFFVVESVCVAWFSLEFVVRFLHAPCKLAFLRGPLNVIDAAAILPYYLSLVVEALDAAREDPAAGWGSLNKVGLILRVMRALRILYVMRLARHSLGLQTLGLTIQRSMTDFGLLMLFICVAVTLFSPLVHLAESELAPQAARSARLSFSSIPASYWWAVIAVTKVGYGDMVPHSVPGQLVALVSILAGILILAYPSTAIFHVFARTYDQLKDDQGRRCREERSARLAAADAELSLLRGREAWPPADELDAVEDTLGPGESQVC